MATSITVRSSASATPCGRSAGAHTTVPSPTSRVWSPTVILAWPAAILTGVAFGMPMAAWTASRKTEQSFAFVFRFIITPLFLFSGTFFPLEQLPEAVRGLAWLTPLFHGVSLTRALAIGHDLNLVTLAIHTLVLVGVAAVGTLLALRTFKKRLVV